MEKIENVDLTKWYKKKCKLFLHLKTNNMDMLGIWAWHKYVCLKIEVYSLFSYIIRPNVHISNTKRTQLNKIIYSLTRYRAHVSVYMNIQLKALFCHFIFTLRPSPFAFSSHLHSTLAVRDIVMPLTILCFMWWYNNHDDITLLEHTSARITE